MMMMMIIMELVERDGNGMCGCVSPLSVLACWLACCFNELLADSMFRSSFAFDDFHAAHRVPNTYNKYTCCMCSLSRFSLSLVASIIEIFSEHILYNSRRCEASPEQLFEIENLLFGLRERKEEPEKKVK